MIGQDRFERSGQNVFPSGTAQKMYLGARQINGGRNEAQAINSGHGTTDIGNFGPSDQHIMKRGAQVVRIEAQ